MLHDILLWKINDSCSYRDSELFYIYFLFPIEIRSHSVISAWLIKSDKENTLYKEIELLISNTCPILLSHKNPLLIHSMI